MAARVRSSCGGGGGEVASESRKRAQYGAAQAAHENKKRAQYGVVSLAAASPSRHLLLLLLVVVVFAFCRYLCVPLSLRVMDLGMGMGGRRMGADPSAGGEGSVVDTAEMVYISSLALLKMLKHGTSYSVAERERERSARGLPATST